MYIDDHINNKMSEIKNIDDMSIFIKDNIKSIIRYEHGIVQCLRDLPTTDTINHSGILNLLFFNQSKMADITETYFNILYAYCNKVIIDNMNYFDDKKYFILYLLLLDEKNLINIENKLKEKDLTNYTIGLRLFLRAYFDIYIPTDEPEIIIDKIIKDSDSSLVKIYESPEYFQLKEIYNRMDLRHEAIQNYLIYNNITTVFLYKVNEIASRFVKYYSEDETISYIYDILYDMTCNKNITEVLSNIMSEIIEKYGKININVFHLLLLEINSLSSSIIDLYHYNDYKDIIEGKKYMEYLEKNEEIQTIEASLYHNPNDGLEYVIEAYKKDSVVMHDEQHKIYKAFKNYKNAEDKIDSQLTKMVNATKTMFLGDVRTEIIDGNKVTPLGLLKKALGTAAIFAFGPIKGLILLVVRYSLKKQTTVSERKKIILELEAELEMIEEKIEDARGDGNRQAKYALMRTRTELNNAIRKIKMGLEADQKSIDTAKNLINRK